MKFKCAICDTEFHSTRSLDRAVEEFEQNFPGDDLNGLVSLCDPCYQKALPRLQKLAEERRRRE